jgi:hypothetical protein
MRFIFLTLIQGLILLKDTSSASVTTNTLFGIRGGSSPYYSRTATPVRPTSTRTSSSTKVRYPIVQDLDPDDEEAINMDFSKNESKEAAKEMMDAFLTRDSRNSFIGELRVLMYHNVVVVSNRLFDSHHVVDNRHSSRLCHLIRTIAGNSFIGGPVWNTSRVSSMAKSDDGSHSRHTLLTIKHRQLVFCSLFPHCEA